MFAHLHKTVCKVEYVLVNTFHELFAKGFCTPPDMEETTVDEQAGGEMAGMGEGEGEKDVSNEIQDEEQLTGTQDQAPGDTRQDLEEQEDGVEMSADFDGELYDVERKEGDDSPDDKDEQGDEV
jgi:midasin (ATPase involved in ribosome maturation)